MSSPSGIELGAYQAPTTRLEDQRTPLASAESAGIRHFATAMARCAAIGIIGEILKAPSESRAPLWLFFASLVLSLLSLARASLGCASWSLFALLVGVLASIWYWCDESERGSPAFLVPFGLSAGFVAVLSLVVLACHVANRRVSGSAWAPAPDPEPA